MALRLPASVRRPLSAIADGILNLLYPADCLLCGAPVAAHRDRSVCDRCWSATAALRLEPPWCPSCGLPLPWSDRDGTDLCGRCMLDPPPYAGARSFGAYGGGLRQLIHQFKFRGRQDLALRFAPLLDDAFRRSWRQDAFDLIVPVPLSGSRRRERGYNQSALLARRLGRSLGLSVDEGALVRVRRTPPQVGLSDAARRANVRGAFRVSRRSEHVSGSRVLLVDDVMTTGATAASAAGALRGGGAARVSVLTLARAVDGLD